MLRMLKQLLYTFIFLSSCIAQNVRIPQVDFSPARYICFKSGGSITIDGKLDEVQWSLAEWSTNFVDIRGRSKPAPRFRTSVKMLWDNRYFYIAAELEETDVWGTLTNRDDTLYKENNFEVFIDPDGDTGNYCELEINALNTIWDLLLIKPYRDMKKPSISGWDIKGLKSGVAVFGTLNTPWDKDSCWTVEIAFPWKAFKELTDVAIPPRDGDQWRVNFSRVECQIEKKGDALKKRVNSVTNKSMQNFWVWSPQGIVNMHYPEMWGYVQFSTEMAGGNPVDFMEKNEEQAKWFLRQIYYKERIYYQKHTEYTSDMDILDIKNRDVAGYITPPVIKCTPNMFEATLLTKDRKTKICIRNDGLIYSGENIIIK